MQSLACTALLLELFTSWIGSNLGLGIVLYALIYAACTVLVVPTSALTLGGGFAFTQAIGLGPGLLVVSLTVLAGASLGAILAFLLGRYLLHTFVQRLIARWKITQAIDHALKKAGLKVNILLRLSPIIPFNLYNYAMSGTSVRFRDYVLALPMMLPGTVSYALLGASVGEATSTAASGTVSSSQALQTILLVIGSITTVVAVFIISYVARRELKKAIDKAEVTGDGVAAVRDAPADDRQQMDSVR